jgi:catechol 2,3-dioxygenase-like lactoylglutathione lyase family enzyme
VNGLDRANGQDAGHQDNDGQSEFHHRFVSEANDWTTGNMSRHFRFDDPITAHATRAVRRVEQNLRRFGHAAWERLSMFLTARGTNATSVRVRTQVPFPARASTILLPQRKRVTHVPGLMCYLCTRFVPTVEQALEPSRPSFVRSCRHGSRLSANARQGVMMESKMLIGTLTAFVASAQPEQAKRFYRDTLDLRLVSDDQFALVFDCAGVPLRIQKVKTLRPHPFTALGWQVPSIRRRVSTLAKRGVVFERFGFMEQDERGVWQSPSGAKVAWFKDPDGNLLSLTEMGLPDADQELDVGRR